MSVTDELLENNAAYAESFKKGDLPLPPARGVAVVACMDARLDVHKILGLEEGDAHVIRNAGGVITDDEIRSLTISQPARHARGRPHPPHRLRDAHLLRRRVEGADPRGGGREAPLLDGVLLRSEGGRAPQSIARIKASPFVPHKQSVRGFFYEVETGRLQEVT